MQTDHHDRRRARAQARAVEPRVDILALAGLLLALLLLLL